jgi:hypothetical protein
LGGGDGAKIRGEGICMNKLLEGGYQFFSRKWGGGLQLNLKEFD